MFGSECHNASGPLVVQDDLRGQRMHHGSGNAGIREYGRVGARDDKVQP